MNLGELRKLIADLPDDTEVWDWNDHSGHWDQIMHFQIGLQHPKHREAIFSCKEHFEEEMLECNEDFKISINQMKKVIII